ncbi:uncharacterized protein LOC114437371 [Parambassis ranga]|uniref:Uncharacterized protein LOC114437371 n=1 Tax=Parambassis ranga TaxID=210632 RepID=A0A6P7IGG4_9TELE|nr:uncharacterized protein LOC114437371 [Parambassis ranga]
MSSEVCPFCGKTYKRLKSHLPHCKAAPSSKTPPTKHEVTASQTAASLSKPAAAKAKKSTQAEKVSSALKKTAAASPSPNKPKKQTLHALREAAKKASEDLPPDSRTADKSAHAEPKDAPKKSKKAAQTVPTAHEEHRFWEDSDMKARITVQDVRATLGRTTRSRPSILSQIEAAEVPVRPPVENQTLSEKRPAEKSKQLAALIALREPASPSQLRLPPPAAPLLPAVQSAPPAVSLKVTGLLHFPLTPLSEPGTKKQHAAVSQAEGALTHRSLGQVRLKELPDWLARKAPTHPRDVIDMMHRGWQWYYRKYIDVKKGGVAGVGMLLAGYCVLSYTWNYPHIKHDRWRKYH